MSISFSGLASGLDTSSWVESLVALKKAKVTTLEEEKKETQSLQETLTKIKSFFSSFRSMLEKVTDAKLGLGTSMDLFAQNLATSSNLEALTASATWEAEEASYNVLVDKLASETKVNSNYSYMTTIVQTTTATGDSKLINLGVKAGNIGVMVNGVEHGINITENDTLSTFIEKLNNIGVKANYNENSGIFSIDISANSIHDIDSTNIVGALHLTGVNEGYQSNNLQTSKTDTIFSAATVNTKLTDLGVKTGIVTVHANDKDYSITINNDSTLGSFIADLNKNNIEADLDGDGVFSIKDAEITNEGTTDILNALGLNSSIYNKSQITGNLSHKSTITQTTTATSDTLLKDLGNGTEIKDGQTVIVKNSNNETTTITVGTSTTLGDLLAGLSNAGLYAALKSDGTVEITGGTITGGTFDALKALGLSSEPYSAVVTGKPLTETVEVHELVNLQTRLVDDLKVKEGYLEVTDANGDKYYEKIYSGQTIADFMTDMGNLGINTKLDENTGILTITGGAFKTLSDADVAALMDNKTIVPYDDRYKKGTNLLQCLYGADTIATDQITVASTYSKTKALRHTVTNTINATKTTTLDKLGLSGNGTAIFDVRGEQRTITVTQNMTIEGLMETLKDAGIGSSWNEDTSRLTIENATITGGTSNLSNVLDLTTTISGKYVTSSNLYSTDTITIDATRDTILKDYGITSSMSEADRTVNIYKSDGTIVASTVVNEGTTVGDLLDFINAQDGISASLKDGFLTITNGYLSNATLENTMGLTTTNKSSFVLGSVMTSTTTAAVTGETTLGEIISTLGTSDKVKDGYTLLFNSKTIEVSATTTINDLINSIYANGGTATLDNTGRLAINGGTLTGSVAEALGMTSYVHTSSVSSTGETLYIKKDVCADRSTKLSELGVTGDISYVVYNSLSQATTTVTLKNTASLGEFLDGLKNNGIDGIISEGVIKLTSAEGNYISGELATKLGLTAQTVTEVVNTTAYSTALVQFTASGKADLKTKLDAITTINASNNTMTVYDSENNAQTTITVTGDTTLDEWFGMLAKNGIQAEVNDGVISFVSEAGNYVSGALLDEFGMTTTTVTVTKTTGTAGTSDKFTYTDTENAKLSDTLGTFITVDGEQVITVKSAGAGATAGTVTVTSDTTFEDLFRALDDLGIQGTMEDGVITLTSTNSNWATGDVLTALGISAMETTTTATIGQSVTSTAAISYTITHAITENDYLPVGEDGSSLVVSNKAGNALTTITVTNSMTFGQLFRELSQYDIDADIHDGVIKLTSPTGNIVGGDFATTLGINMTTIISTKTVGKTVGSTLEVTYTNTVAVSGSTQIGDIYIVEDGVKLKDTEIWDELFSLESEDGSYTPINVLDKHGTLIDKIKVGRTDTFDDLAKALKPYGELSLSEDGVLSFNSKDGNVIQSYLTEGLGMNKEITRTTVTVGSTMTSTAAVTFTSSQVATLDTTLGAISGNSKIDGVITANGVTGNVIGISTAEELTLLASLSASNTFAGKTFVLTDDIDLTGVEWQGIGSDSVFFSGIFDGQGHTISGLSITSSDNQNIGFFSRTQNAEIKNLIIDAPTADLVYSGGNAYFGVLVGRANSSVISNVEVRNMDVHIGATSEVSAGGLVGWVHNNGTIIGCSTSGGLDISRGSNYRLGGIVGDWAWAYGSISQSSSNLNIIGFNSNNTNSYGTGGIVGRYLTPVVNVPNTALDISNCIYSGNILTRSGGIVGRVTKQVTSARALNITNCISNSNATNGFIYEASDCTKLSVNIANSIHTSSVAYSNTLSRYATIKTNNVRKGTAANLNSIAQNFAYDTSIWDLSGSAPALQANGQYSLKIFDPSTNSYVYTTNLSASSTVRDVVSALSPYGDVTFEDGVLTFTGKNGTVLTGGIADMFGIKVNTTVNTVGVTATSNTAITYNKEQAALTTTRLGSIIGQYTIDGAITSSGVTGNVIAISNATQMKYLEALVNSGKTMQGKTFVLTSNINMSSIDDWSGIGFGTNFMGTFDGQGYTISNLNLSNASDSYSTGLFCEVHNATIKNVNLANFSYDNSTTHHNVGLLVSTLVNSNVSNVHVTSSTIKEAASGALIYQALGTDRIENCSTDFTYTIASHMTSFAGGILTAAANASYANHANITIVGCSSTMDARGDIFMGGGMVAFQNHLESATINLDNCSFSGNIISNRENSVVAGLVGVYCDPAMTTKTNPIINIKNCAVKTDSIRVPSTGVASVHGEYQGPKGTSAMLVGGTIHNGSKVTINVENVCYAALSVYGSAIEGDYGRASAAVKLTDYVHNNSYEDDTNLYTLTSSNVKSGVINSSRLDTAFTDAFAAVGFDTRWSSNGTLNVQTSMYTLDIMDKNGNAVKSMTLSTSSTLESLLTTLRVYGTADLSEDGVLTFTSKDGYYLSGNICDKLGIKTAGAGEGGVNTPSRTLTTRRTATATEETDIYDLLGESQNMIVNDGHGQTYTVDVSEYTIGELFDYLAQFNIVGTIKDGIVTFTPKGDAYIETFDAAADFNMDYGDEQYTTNTIKTNTTGESVFSDTTATINTSTTLAELGSKGTNVVVNDGKGGLHTIALTSTSTIDDLFTALAAFDISGTIGADGKVKFEALGDAYLQTFDIKDLLNMTGQATSTTKENTTFANTSSETLKEAKTFGLTKETKLGDLMDEKGITSDGIEILVEDCNGNGNYTEFSRENTVEDVMLWLAGNNVSSQIVKDLLILNSRDTNAEHGIINVSVSKFFLDIFNLSKKQEDYYQQVTSTTFQNTTSGSLTSTLPQNLTTSTKLSDIALSENATVTVVNNGTEYTLTFQPDSTIDDVISTLAGLGISGSVKDGKLTLLGTKDAYILGMSDNLKGALNLAVGENNTYIGGNITIGSNTLSDKQSHDVTYDATSTTKMSQTNAGLGTITVNYQGATYYVTATADKTIGDVLTELAGYGISGSIDGGVIKLQGTANGYITDAGGVFGLTGSFYDTAITTVKSQNTSGDVTYTSTNAAVTADTVLSTINGFSNGSGSLVVHKTDGTFVTISVDATKTLGEFFNDISRYGLVGKVDSEGKVSIEGIGNVYLQQTTGGSNILEALNLSNVTTNVRTVTVNRTSDTLHHTVTVAASNTTTLENLLDKNGNGITFTDNKAGLILHTYSDAGNKFVTLDFSKTQTIYDVIDELAKYGIDAKLDANGRFSVSSSTLTDFDMLGDLGTFLMGNYSKEYGKDTTNNVSAILAQQTIVKMTDSSKLADFGITSGDILVNQEGVKYTINIDTTKVKTIGDFRNMLSHYGFTSYIDDAGRLNVLGVGNSSLENINGGSNILTVLGLTDWTLGEVTQQSGHLTDTEVEVRKISMADKLKDLTDTNGVNLGITAGQIYVYQDGTRTALNIDVNDTLETLAAKLSQFGISVGISQEGKLYFDGNNDSYLTTNGIITANASNILQKFGVSGDWSTRYDSTSKNLNYTENEDKKVSGSTKLSDLKDTNGNNLGITTGSFYVYNSGVRNTETITDDMTVNDLMSTLAKYGLVADFDENGVMSVGAYNNTYLATSALAGDNSNIVNNLFEQWNFVNIYTSNNLDIPKDVVQAITRDTKLKDINEGTYKEGYITVVKDGVKTNISLTADDTVGPLMDELALYGFESVINDKGQLMIKNTGDSLLQNYTDDATKASNALELLGIDLNSWINTNTYDSKTLEVNKTSTVDAAATRDTLLSQLGVTTGEYYIYNNGVKYTALISSDETLGSFMDTLKSFGIETSLVNGADGSILKIIGKGDSYIKKSTSTTNSSNVVEKLFTGDPKSSLEYTGLEQTSSIQTTFTAATEDTLLSSFDQDWGGTLQKSEGNLTVVVNGQKNTISISADETIGSLLDKFKALGLEATISKDGQIVIQSGYNSLTIATDGTDSKLVSNINLKHEKDLGGYSASSTVLEATTSDIVEKTLSIANYADMNTKLSDLNISEGTLTLYRDGQKAQVTIGANDTFANLQTRISTEFKNDNDVIVGFEDGKLKIYSNSGKKIEVGSTSDGSNFGAITGISTDENGIARSARELYCVTGDSLVTASGIFRRGDVTAGTFVVGNATFTIDNNTTLSNLISQINSSDDANATAFWDNVDGKFVIKSRTTGSALVNIEAGTSNFTDILGFTTSTWKNGAPDGNTKAESTKMNVNTQEIGDNAKIKINGTTYTSTSNTIGSDVTRIKGLTINLKGLAKDSSVTLKVERDKETLANAVSGVVDSYNELMKNVDEAIASDGDLKNESTLKLIRNQLRNLMTSSDAGTTVFKNLDSIGITASAASGSNISTTNSAIVSLTFDKDKFFKAFEADQNAVKELIIGGANNKGIFTKVEDEVEGTLKAVSGYFAATEKSYKQKIQDLDKKITRANKEVDRYKARLESKFQSMDMLIARMQQQYSSFLTT